MGLNITQFAEDLKREDEGQIVHLHDLAGEPLYDNEQPVTITVAGSYSTHYRKQQDRLRAQAARRRGRLKIDQLATEAELELQAACILAWQGITEDGKPLPCTFENAKRLLETLPPIRDQVVEVMYDHEGFTKSASQT